MTSDKKDPIDIWLSNISRDAKPWCIFARHIESKVMKYAQMTNYNAEMVITTHSMQAKPIGHKGRGDGASSKKG